MAFSFKNGANALDDYIIECESIPLWQRNRDFTIAIPEFTMLISEKITTSLIDEGDKISVYYNSSTIPIFVGYITRKKYEYQSRAYRITVTHLLIKLTERYITYSELHSVLVAGATSQQYLASDNMGYPSVQVLWILEKMFDQCGLNLYTTNLGTRAIETITFDSTDRDIQFQHLRMDENMFYAINQPVATLYSTLDASLDYVNNRMTFFDFFSLCCSYIGGVGLETIGYTCRITFPADTLPTAEQIRISIPNHTLFTVTDDNSVDKETDNIVGKEGGYSFDIQFNDTDRAVYASVSESNLVSHETISGNGKNNIDHPTNFVFLYEKFWDSAGYVVGFTTYPDYYYPATAMLYNKINAAVGDWDTYKWKEHGINLTGRGVAKSYKVDPVNYITEFEQEILR